MKKIIYSIAMLLLPVMAFAQYSVIPSSDNLNGFSGCTAAAYPNPGNGLIKVYFSKDNFTDASVIVCDHMGKPVYQRQHLNTNPVSLDLSKLPPGIYMAIFTSANRLERINERIVIL